MASATDVGGTNGEVEDVREVVGEVRDARDVREARKGLVAWARREDVGRDGGGKGQTGRKGNNPGNCAWWSPRGRSGGA